MTTELTSPEGTSCVVCGRSPALGYFQIGDDWFCHPDDENEPLCSAPGWKPMGFLPLEGMKIHFTKMFPGWDVTIIDETKKKESH